MELALLRIQFTRHDLHQIRQYLYIYISLIKLRRWWTLLTILVKFTLEMSASRALYSMGCQGAEKGLKPSKDIFYKPK